MTALDGFSDDEFAAARPGLSAIFAEKLALDVVGIVLIPVKRPYATTESRSR